MSEERLEEVATPEVPNPEEEIQPEPPVVMGVTQKILVRRNKTTGEVMTQQLLFDDHETEHVVITELPTMEERPGFTGAYIVANDGTVTVEYTAIPKSTEEIQNETIAMLMLEVAQLKAAQPGGAQ